MAAPKQQEDVREADSRRLTRSERGTGIDDARPRRRGPRGLRLQTPIPRWQALALGVGVFSTLAIAWWVITEAGAVKPLFLPPPDAVFSKLNQLASDGTLWEDTRISFVRIMFAFLLASAMALPVGVLVGSFRAWAAAVQPLVDFIRYMPVVAFVPLTILWVGTDESQKYLIIWIGTFFQQVLLIADNVKRVPVDFIDLGRTLGMPDRTILRRIVVRSSAPGIWDSLRISLGWAWTWLVLAELVAATSGLGYRIVTAQRYFQTETIIGYILILGLLGLITDQTMRASGRKLFAWAEVQR